MCLSLVIPFSTMSPFSHCSCLGDTGRSCFHCLCDVLLPPLRFGYGWFPARLRPSRIHGAISQTAPFRWKCYRPLTLCSGLITQCRRRQNWQAPPPRPICISKPRLNSPAICKRAWRSARQHAVAAEPLWQMRLPFPAPKSHRQLTPGFTRITADKLFLKEY